MMYTETERRIFGPYFDGAQERYADPLAVQRQLKLLLGPDVDLLVKQYSSDLAEEALPAAHRFLSGIIAAFGVHGFDPATGQGLLENEVVALWNGFQDWLSKKKASTSSSPTASPSSVGAGPVSGPATRPTAGSSSTWEEYAAANPGRRQTAGF